MAKYLNILLLFSYFYFVQGFRDLCKGTNVDCNESLFGQRNDNHSGVCNIIYYPTNSSQCFNKAFLLLNGENADLGKVQLKPYYELYGGLREYTFFNVTLSDIKWTYFSFRYQASIDFKNNSMYKNHCRDIMISVEGELPKRSSLSYDCPWSARQDFLYEGRTYTFEYQATNGVHRMSGKYVFIVPRARFVDPSTPVSDWAPFVYVEINMNSLIVHIVEAPLSYNITAYRIVTYHRSMVDGSGYTSDTHAPFKNETVRNEHLEIMYSVETRGYEGSFYFDIIPLSENCLNSLCYTATTPIIEIEIDRESYIICIASTASLVSALIIFSIFVIRYFYGNKKGRLHEDILLESSPRVLIIHKPVSKPHYETVANLVECLREIGISVAYIKDIERTAHHDPFVWCQEEFEKADCLLYVVSPPTESEVQFGIHRNVDTVALNFLKYSMADKRMNKRLVNVTFDYCVGGDELFMGKSFRLPKDWNSMMQYICKDSKTKIELRKTDRQKELLGNLLLCINKAKYNMKMKDVCGGGSSCDDTNILI